MKNLRKGLNISIIFLLVLVLTSCSGLSQRSMYTGNIMGIDAQVIVEHSGNKINKVNTDIEVGKEYFEMLTSIAGSGYVNANENEGSSMDDLKGLSTALKAFNHFSFKMFDGLEINVTTVNDKFVINTNIDYNKVNMDTLKELAEMIPDLSGTLKEIDEYRNFENFEKEVLNSGLRKKY